MVFIPRRLGGGPRPTSCNSTQGSSPASDAGGFAGGKRTIFGSRSGVSNSIAKTRPNRYQVGSGVGASPARAGVTPSVTPSQSKWGFYDALVGKKRREKSVSNSPDKNNMEWGGYESKKARGKVEFRVGGVRKGRIKTVKQGGKTIVKVSPAEKVTKEFLDKLLIEASEKLGKKKYRDLKPSKKKKFKTGIQEAINNQSKITGKDLF